MHNDSIDLSRWRELRRFGSTYLLWDEITREGALFDPTAELEPLLHIDAEHIQLRHVFLTNPAAPLDIVRVHCPKFLLHTSTKSAPPQHRNRSNDFIHLGSLRITNRGYGEEGVIYIIGNWPEDAPHVVILGQNEGISSDVMREKVWTLPPETLVCPARGEITTVKELSRLR